ncbi:type II toxin-antitoxin system RelE/ParE family toxin [Rouxiella sp. WC2420]|uniref:type II toxin-antitoxin system RelE/ParE family toxin n=1 Tax=Rouxiella sp. WC2420 TaxID=3234145 RepID=UPI00350EC7BB
MWEVETTELFDTWFVEQEDELQVRLLAGFNLIEQVGPTLARPYADILKGSRHANMKELRVQYDGHPIRAFFAFDPIRNAVVFCAGDKKGANEQNFIQS